MKIGSDIKLIYDSNNDCHLDAFAAIADEWNEDLKHYEEQTERSAIVYDKLFDRYEKARKQLRKLRHELVETKGQAGAYYMQLSAKDDMLMRLENLIERIAKVKK